MAQIDIGKIKPVFKGTYDNSTAYVLDDIVYYNGSSYVAKTSTTGNLPTDTTKWNVLASGSGGIWDSTLALGTAGKILQVNSGATALEFTDKPVGGVLSSHSVTDGNRFTITGSNTTTQQVGNLAITLTPASSSSKFLLMSSFVVSHTNYGSHMSFMRNSTDVATALAVSPSNRIPGLWSQYATSADFTISGAMSFLDSPNTTSSITYKVGTKIRGSNTWYFNYNQSNQDTDDHVSGVSTFQILELGV